MEVVLDKDESYDALYSWFGNREYNLSYDTQIENDGIGGYDLWGCKSYEPETNYLLGCGYFLIPKELITKENLKSFLKYEKLWIEEQLEKVIDEESVTWYDNEFIFLEDTDFVHYKIEFSFDADMEVKNENSNN